MRNKLQKTLLVSGLLAALFAAPVFADEAADVGKLMRAGQYGEALSKVDAILAQRPKDAQMRFMKGVILTEQNKSSEAIAIFTDLTKDFPELPEPYNNLAVLYAAAGQYEKARAALDMAIRTNPSYATAYENLGDIHAKLASQAYDKALQLDSSNTTAKSKLTLLRSLGNATASAGKAASAGKPTAVASVTTTTMKVASAPQAVIAKPEPKPEAKPAAKPEANDAGEREEVLNAVHAWAEAWSAQDVKAYLSHYAGDFQTPKGESHSAWAEERRQRIAGKGRISVKVESPQVSVEGNTATVHFRQVYVSDRLKADSRKVLVLAKHNGRWQIKQERSGS
jgi:tetratricopeptide (TPR) repeat protein